MATLLHDKKQIDTARNIAGNWLAHDKVRRGRFLSWWRDNYAADEDPNTMKSRIMRMAGLAPYYIIGKGCDEWLAVGIDNCLIGFYEENKHLGVPAPLYSPARYFSSLRERRGFLRKFYTYMNDRDMGYTMVNNVLSPDYILSHTERVGIIGLINEFKKQSQ